MFRAFEPTMNKPNRRPEGRRFGSARNIVSRPVVVSGSGR
jgi:hypothetical protein